MKCKCKICGHEIDNKSSFLIREVATFDRNGEPKLNKNGIQKTKKEYCCNEAEYNDYLREKAENKAAELELWGLVTEYVGETNNTALYTERRKWGDARKVCRLIKENKDKFDYMRTKTFDRMYSKIMYFSAIIKNNIDDLPDEPIKEEIPQEVQMEFYENKRKVKIRKGLLDDE